MIVLLDRKHLEPPLPNMAAGAIMLVVAADVCVLQPVHPPAQIAVGDLPEHQMKVVGHQAIGQYAHRRLDASVLHRLEEGVVVAVLQKDVTPSVAPIR